MDATDESDRNKEAVKRRIQKKVPKLMKRVNDFVERMEDPKFLDIKSPIYDILREIDQLEAEAKHLSDRAKKYKEWQ